MRAVLRLCEFYPGICLTTEEKARKNLSQGKKTSVKVRKTSVRVQYTCKQVHFILCIVQINPMAGSDSHVFLHAIGIV